MEKVKVEYAIGMFFAHDLRKILPGKYKGTLFKKGHILQGGVTIVTAYRPKEWCAYICST